MKSTFETKKQDLHKPPQKKPENILPQNLGVRNLHPDFHSVSNALRQSKGILNEASTFLGYASIHTLKKLISDDEKLQALKKELDMTRFQAIEKERLEKAKEQRQAKKTHSVWSSVGDISKALQASEGDLKEAAISLGYNHPYSLEQRIKKNEELQILKNKLDEARLNKQPLERKEQEPQTEILDRKRESDNRWNETKASKEVLNGNLDGAEIKEKKIIQTPIASNVIDHKPDLDQTGEQEDHIKKQAFGEMKSPINMMSHCRFTTFAMNLGNDEIGEEVNNSKNAENSMGESDFEEYFSKGYY